MASDWPGTAGASVEDLRFADCAACGERWRVHRDLAGFRIRCTCGTFVVVPPEPAPAQEERPLLLARCPPRALVASPYALAGAERLPLVRTGAAGEVRGALEGATVRERARFTDRTLIELFLLLAALVGPHLAIFLAAGPRAQLVAMPLASVIAGVLVLFVAATVPEYAFGALVRPRPGALVEAAVYAVLCASAATAYAALLTGDPRGGDHFGEWRAELGLPAVFLVVAICPGIFEEIAFRGLLHARLTALFGRDLGLAIAAAAFALAHGPTLGLPIHFALGLLLGRMRNRTGSLVPGMLFHVLYNGLLVAVAAS